MTASESIVPEPPVGSSPPAVQQVGEALESAQQSAQQVAVEQTVPGSVALWRGRGAVAAAAAAFAGFLAIFLLVRAKRTAAVDTAVTMKLQARRWPLLSQAMKGASWVGFPPQSRIIPPAMIGSLWALNFRLEALYQLAGWATALISTVVKRFMKRPRPVAGRDIRVAAARLGGTSFPSGHTITYVGTYGAAAYLAHSLIKPAGPRRLVVGVLTALVALVGPSRIYQGHHWATDVSASYMLGFSYLLGITALYRHFKERLVRGERVAGIEEPRVTVRPGR